MENETTYTIKITAEEKETIKKFLVEVVKDPKMVDTRIFDLCLIMLDRLDEAEKDIKF